MHLFGDTRICIVRRPLDLLYRFDPRSLLAHMLATFIREDEVTKYTIEIEFGFCLELELFMFPHIKVIIWKEASALSDVVFLHL
jgi:hypothetical protein